MNKNVFPKEDVFELKSTRSVYRFVETFMNLSKSKDFMI